ncbi:hypothetical protein C8F04DRAFT_1096976 [Mycena alexandri]|uniref:Ubiquitin-like protease family profile domain-containing protein n=1 Tax=Mycena alexandri TaxID=1745969 RepID=A0AAD6SZV3_9AGAR|nr:hypothetical protein C8F04DRAFT_1096976 [Mycena alexandri]
MVDSLTITRLRHLDMPSVKVIRRLAHDVQQAWLDGFTSVKCAHITGEGVTHFPLWVIMFWNAVADIRGNVRKPWITSRDWVKDQLESKRKPDVRKYATEVTRLLGILPWNTLKRGLSDASPVHSLSRFLGKRWLSSTDINDMLEMLREKIAADPELAGLVRVEMVEFTAKVTAAFRARESEDYHRSKSTKWLRALGEDIFGNGERLITVAHLGDHNDEKHWITIEVNGADTLFRYGDSFKDDIPPSLWYPPKLHSNRRPLLWDACGKRRRASCLSRHTFDATREHRGGTCSPISPR